MFYWLYTVSISCHGWLFSLSIVSKSTHTQINSRWSQFSLMTLSTSYSVNLYPRSQRYSSRLLFPEKFTCLVFISRVVISLLGTSQGSGSFLYMDVSCPSLPVTAVGTVQSDPTDFGLILDLLCTNTALAHDFIWFLYAATPWKAIWWGPTKLSSTHQWLHTNSPPCDSQDVLFLLSMQDLFLHSAVV